MPSTLDGKNDKSEERFSIKYFSSFVLPNKMRNIIIIFWEKKHRCPCINRPNERYKEFVYKNANY